MHIPGSIQSHGIVLVLGGAADRTPDVLASSRPDCRALHDVLDPDAVARIAGASGRPAGQQVLEGLRDHDGRRWIGVLHSGHDATLLELEPEPSPDPAKTHRILASLNQAIALLRHETDPVAACRIATDQLRAVTGFDRVMAYRFMPDWSGEVLAESLGRAADGAPPIDSYLGLVFPASDIPAPARALYAASRLRLIPDTRAAADPLLALRHDCPQPIDLSRAVLRGVAPVHLQYLANMGVRASMSIAIATPEQPLWGLIACHHQAGPLFVDRNRREAAETVVQALSWRLAELVGSETARRVAALDRALSELLSPLFEEHDPAALAPPSAALSRKLLAACDATGIAVLTSGASPFGLDLRLGDSPDEAGLARLASWLDTTLEPDQALFQTDRLPALVPADLADALTHPGSGPVCGLSAARLDEGWIVWFRPELRRLVDWAGHKQTPDDPDLPLRPRASFAAWRELVAGRSASWPDWSAAAVRHLRERLTAAQARLGAAAARTNADLQRRNEEVRFFADAATHDLKEPLWQIQVLGELVRDGLADLLDTPDAAFLDRAAELDLSPMAELVVSSAGRMRQMIEDLARFAIAGRDLDAARPVVLRQLADEALQDLGESLRQAPDSVVDLDGLDDVHLVCDAAQVRRIFQNLFSNALKYRDVGRPLRLTASARLSGDTVLVEVSDNGVGFDPEDRARLFDPFRRFQREGAAADEGLGLGLSICQRIVIAHGGRIEATPLAPGARFGFTLPVGGPRRQDTPVRGAPDQEQGR